MTGNGVIGSGLWNKGVRDVRDVRAVRGPLLVEIGLDMLR